MSLFNHGITLRQLRNWTTRASTMKEREITG